MHKTFSPRSGTFPWKISDLLPYASNVQIVDEIGAQRGCPKATQQAQILQVKLEVYPIALPEAPSCLWSALKVWAFSGMYFTNTQIHCTSCASTPRALSPHITRE